jgi:serine/threonine protein kinase
MGVVYQATRADEQYEKKVAVKLVHRGLLTSEARRRFFLERQALARLEHANIARLLDGGVTDEGIPYLVMEYVQGDPIDVHASRTVGAHPDSLLGGSVLPSLLDRASRSQAGEHSDYRRRYAQAPRFWNREDPRRRLLVTRAGGDLHDRAVSDS